MSVSVSVRCTRLKRVDNIKDTGTGWPFSILDTYTLTLLTGRGSFQSGHNRRDINLENYYTGLA